MQIVKVRNAVGKDRIAYAGSGIFWVIAQVIVENVLVVIGEATAVYGC